jgi:hypothetical protein
MKCERAERRAWIDDEDGTLAINGSRRRFMLCWMKKRVRLQVVWKFTRQS